MVNIGIETEQIEYKKTTGELKEAITSIVAILNKHGSGELYFGVRNNGDVLDDVLNDVLEKQIIRLLSENDKLNQKQIAAKTGKSIVSVQRAMKKLSERGKILRVGGKRFGHWEVK